MSERYAVIGNPVSHSLSPRIHAAFARQTGQDMEYGRLEAARDGFNAAVEGFRAEGGRGLNVTLPFKPEAYEYAGTRTPRAEAAQAVNTLAFGPDGVTGDNTDGAGLVRDLESNLGYAIVANRVLVLGAGGAARGILGPLMDRLPVTIFIANRDTAKARALAERAAGRGSCGWGGYQDLVNRQFDLIINATAASLGGELPPLPAALYAPRSLAYDLMYAAAPTPFMRHALASGAARAADGLGMLVEQAAESFLLWRGVRPDTVPVIAALRAELSQASTSGS